MRDPNSRLLLAISVISGFGTTAMMLAAPVWTLGLTGSASLAALCGLFVYVPSLFGPLLGTIADRVPKLALLVCTNVVQAGLLTTLLTVQTRADLWLLFAVMLGSGVALVLRDAAEAGVLQAAIPAEALARLNGVRMSAREGMKLVAPLAGAAIYTWAGGHAVAIIDAAALLVAAALYARIKARAIPKLGRPRLAAPIRFLAAHRQLRRVVLACSLTVAMSGFTTAAQYEVIIEDLHLDPAFAGVLASAQGAGSIVGGLLVGRFLDRFGVGAGALLFGLGCLLRGIPEVPIVIFGSVLAGIGLSWTVVAEMTAVQRHAPPNLVGGVAAASSTLVFAPLTLAIPAGALLVELVDHRFALAIGAAATIALLRIR